jgi:hypothetical protein
MAFKVKEGHHRRRSGVNDIVWLVLVGLASIGPLAVVTIGVAWLASYAKWRVWYRAGRRRG